MRKLRIVTPIKAIRQNTHKNYWFCLKYRHILCEFVVQLFWLSSRAAFPPYALLIAQLKLGHHCCSSLLVFTVVRYSHCSLKFISKLIRLAIPERHQSHQRNRVLRVGFTQFPIATRQLKRSQKWVFQTGWTLFSLRQRSIPTTSPNIVVSQ